MTYNAVIDASALLAFLKDETTPLHDLESLLPKSLISSVNACEVATVLSRLGVPFERATELIDETVGEIIPFSREHYLLAAKLWGTTKKYGLSLGDRACIALAQHMNLPVYTADKIWTKLDIKNLHINLIRS
jgi:PIN domain nuclease of toxin-antitoxin system